MPINTPPFITSHTLLQVTSFPHPTSCNPDYQKEKKEDKKKKGIENVPPKSSTNPSYMYL